MSIHFILLFSMTVFIASIIPGPSMLLALTHGMQYGVRRTAASALGNVLVTLVQASISIAGLGTVLLASHMVFLVIKWAGAAYLIHLGINILRTSDLWSFPGQPRERIEKKPLTKMFLQAVFVTAGNPKAILFFTAVYPQFIHPDETFFSQSSLLLGITAFIAFSCFMLYAFGGQKIVRFFSMAKCAKIMKNFVGASFIGAGIGLAVSQK